MGVGVAVKSARKASGAAPKLTRAIAKGKSSKPPVSRKRGGAQPQAMTAENENAHRSRPGGSTGKLATESAEPRPRRGFWHGA